MANNEILFDVKRHYVAFSATVVGSSGTIYATDIPSNEILFDEKASLDWEQEPGQVFYRAKINGKIQFVRGLAKAIVERMPADGYVDLYLRERLYDSSGDVWPSSVQFNRYQVFRVGLSDLKVKTNTAKIYPNTGGSSYKREYVVEATNLVAMDRYENILNNWEKEYDLIKLKVPTTRIQYVRRPCLQAYIPGSGYLANFLGGNYWEQEVSSPEDKVTSIVDTWHFKLCKVLFTIRISGSSDSNANGIYTFVADSNVVNSSYYLNQYVGPMYKVGETSSNAQYRIWIQGWPDQLPSGFSYLSLDRKSGSSWTSPTQISLITPYKTDWSVGVEGLAVVDTYGMDYNLSNPTQTVHWECFMTGVWARWILPTNSFGSRTTYKLSATDDLLAGDTNYRYVAQAQDSDLTINPGTLNTAGSYGQNDLGQYFNPPSSGATTHAPFIPSAWDYTSYWINKNSYNTTVESQGRETVSIRDAYKLKDILMYLFAACYSNTESLLPSDLFTIQDKTSVVIGDDDYLGVGVTLSTLFLIPKSNIVRGLYESPAQKAPITLKSVMDLLKDYFGLYWLSTSAGNVTVSFWDYFYAQDQTEVLIGEDGNSAWINRRNHRPPQYASELIEYSKDEIPEREVISWMDPVTEPFVKPIVRNIGYMVKADEENEKSFGQFNPDMDFMCISPGECSLDGFALKVGATGGDISSIFSPVDGVSYTVSNATISFIRQSWTLGTGFYRQRPTQKWGMLYDQYPGNEYDAQTVKKTSKQIVKYPMILISTTGTPWSRTILDDNWFYKVDTLFGEGIINKASINLTSRFMALNILQDPYDKENI